MTYNVFGGTLNPAQSNTGIHRLYALRWPLCVKSLFKHMK